MKSILTDDLEHCYVCGLIVSDKKDVRFREHIHHVFYGTANRKQSDKYGLIIPLCHYHHTGSNNGVHFNKELDLKIKQIAQKKFEETHTREEFREIFGKSWL